MEEKQHDRAWFAFCRAEAMHSGYGDLLDCLKEAAGGNHYYLFASNPDAAVLIQKMNASHRKLVLHQTSPAKALDELCSRGYRSVTWLVPRTETTASNAMLNELNGQSRPDGAFVFEEAVADAMMIADPAWMDDEQKVFAIGGKYKEFSANLPGSIDEKTRYAAYRFSGGGDGGGETRLLDDYKAGRIYNVGDAAMVGGEEVVIAGRGTNYVIVETADGEKSRQWLRDIAPK